MSRGVQVRVASGGFIHQTQHNQAPHPGMRLEDWGEELEHARVTLARRVAMRPRPVFILTADLLNAGAGAIQPLRQHPARLNKIPRLVWLPWVAFPPKHPPDVFGVAVVGMPAHALALSPADEGVAAESVHGLATKPQHSSLPCRGWRGWRFKLMRYNSVSIARPSSADRGHQPSDKDEDNYID